MAASKVSLGFGLVNIPVALYLAVGEKYSKGKMHGIHTVCGSQIKSPKMCPYCQKIVSADELGKAYEYTKKELIPMTEAELDTLPLASRRNLAVTEFCPAEKLSAIAMVDKIYLIGPGDDKPNTIKAFSLFNTVMGEKHEAGISKIALSSEEHLCFIFSGENFPEYAGKGVMVLQQAPWPSQLKDLSNVGASVPVSDKEKTLAMALIGQLHTDEVDLSKYADVYEPALLALVERKRAGEDISIAAPEPVKAEDTSLMDMLMASVAGK